jgi:hypothetical protein
MNDLLHGRISRFSLDALVKHGRSLWAAHSFGDGVSLRCLPHRALNPKLATNPKDRFCY